MGILLVLAATLLLPACSLLEPEQWERVVGVIEIGGEHPPPVQLPESVEAGVPFNARVVTYGSGNCTKPNGAEVELIGSRAEIVPYDLEYRGPWKRGSYYVACTDDLAPYPREVSLQFDDPGDAEIRVLGRPLIGDGLVEYRFPILVRP